MNLKKKIIYKLKGRMKWIEEYKLLEKDNLELNVIRLLREKIEDISQLNEKYHLFLKEIREIHLFENRKVQEYLIEKMFEKIFDSNLFIKDECVFPLKESGKTIISPQLHGVARTNLEHKGEIYKKKVEEEDDKKHHLFFTMKKIEPVKPFYKRNISIQWKIKDKEEEEDIKEVKKRKFGEICVEKRGEEKKENKKRLKK